MEKLQEMIQTAVRAVNDKKACDMELVRVGGLTTLTEYFLICTGTSTPHVRALADAVEKAVKETFDGRLPHHVEGYREGNWILLDYGELLIHVFLAETRRFYSLERLWGDAPKEDLSRYLPEEEREPQGGET